MLTRIILISCLLVVSLPACASIQKQRCNREFAYNRGYEDGKNADTAKPNMTLGDVCENEYTATTFRKDYLGGYEKGIDEYCSTDRAAHIAHEDAQNFKEKRSESSFEVCKQNQRSKLAKIYNQEYTLKLKEKCTPSTAYSLAVEDARAEHPLTQPIKKLSVCNVVKANEAELLSSYTKGYNETLAAIQKERELELERKRMAEQRRQHEERLAEQRAMHERMMREQREMHEEEMRNRQRHHHPHYPHHYSFEIEGQRLTAICTIEDSKAKIKVTNHGSRNVHFFGEWAVQYYDQSFEPIEKKTTRESLSIWSGRTEKFEEWIIPSNARYCRAEYLGK